MKITYTHEITEKTTPKDILSLLLTSRNIQDIDSFLHPISPLELFLKDFGFKKAEITKMMKLLESIREKDQMIVVYTDYDADGITGGAILWETLHLLGFRVMPYVPHRKTEGYGFSKKGIDSVKKEFNPNLIMSVDHGITAKNEVAYANSLGIDVIVTDHHHRQEEKVPDSAVGIFHIPVLSGSGTAYMVAKEI
ncbi:MAG: DHH family phosphoesterase, partial [Candidatus Roizmanbacteria bacterium]|nr:DHH family phosphoesterase [Candidatus Roizmanbacteria bacterium]